MAISSLKELWRVQSFHHWRHWDFWLSHIIHLGSVYLLILEAVYLWQHRQMYVTVSSAIVGILVGLATFVAALCGAGWVAHVLDKYRHELAQPTSAGRGNPGESSRERH